MICNSNSLAAPICLPEKNEDFLGKFGWAAGWGALNPGSRLRPKTLQAVDVPVIENRVCERWHRTNGINVVIYPEMLCAGYRNGMRTISARQSRVKPLDFLLIT
jgi:transmembrane protease serine 6